MVLSLDTWMLEFPNEIMECEGLCDEGNNTSGEGEPILLLMIVAPFAQIVSDKVLEELLAIKC